MINKAISILMFLIMLVSLIITCSSLQAKDITRPEEIKSKRQVLYDTDTYARLEQQWEEYYDAYPSEYAYANWMYAARYAGDKKYQELLDKGLAKYPANPTILYLKALTCLGKKDNQDILKYLDRAVSLDPGYADPWFVLATYNMEIANNEKFLLALRHLLKSGIIADEVMDYNYNVLMGLEKDAILITNGDNDTYPEWILTYILDVRPDVTIVNRSLLNTEWYPLYIIDHDHLPRFVNKAELEKIRAYLLEHDNGSHPVGGLFSDTLIVKLVESARQSGRPVYLAGTVYYSERLKELAAEGRDLGLAVKITPSKMSYGEELRKTYRTWLNDFRTAGLESWRLKNSPETDASRQLMVNYAATIFRDLDNLKKYAPELRTDLFNWSNKNVEPILTGNHRDQYIQIWCGQSDIKEIKEWCQKQGVTQ